MTSPEAEGPPCRVLIVEDELVLSRLLERRLQRRGLVTSSVASGPEALAALDHDAPPFDIVLLDQMMPRMSGLQVLDRLRERHGRDRIAVVMLTARSESSLVVEALKRGADDFVTKPPDLDVLLARIRTQAERVRAGVALRRSEERYALAAAGSRDGLWDWDVLQDHLYLSERFRDLLGVPTAAPLPGWSAWYDRIHPEDLGRVRVAVREHLDGASDHLRVEHRLQRADGTWAWVMLRGAAVRSSEGKVTRVAGSLTDLSDPRMHDTLTGLPNRHLFMDRLTTALRAGRRDGSSSVAVLMVQVDRLGLLTETHGTRVADALLLELSSRLQSALRDVDGLLTGRGGLGAETGLAALTRSEFAVFCRGLRRPADAARIADRLQALLAAPATIGETSVYPSAAIGIAVANPESTPEEVIRQAVSAMRQAGADRSAHAMYDPELQAEAAARLRLEAELTDAIKGPGLFLAYQPIIDLQSGHIDGFEALVRWQHPERGTIPPNDFIPLAEETRLILPLGTRVLQDACEQAGHWRADRPGGYRVAVNVSAEQFQQTEWAAVVESTLAATGLEPHQLELELTETALATDPDAVAETLAQLRAIGVRISLDDFGTGYSSFGYLQRFAIDTLKIDRSFVDGLPDNEESVAIARAMMAMAGELGMDVVAEGVETREQAEFLKSIGCRYAQGWYFSKAVTAEAATGLIRGVARWRISKDAPARAS